MGSKLKKKGNELDLFIELKDKAIKSNLKLELVNYGIAFRLDDIIVLNKNLLKYEDYCREVFEHEMKHSGEFSKKDLLIDVIEGSLVTNFVFAFKHPKALTHFIPVGKYKKTFMIDVNLMLVYLIGVILVSVFLMVF